MSNKARDGHSSPGQQPQINSAGLRSQSWTVLLHLELVAGKEGTAVTDGVCGNRIDTSFSSLLQQSWWLLDRYRQMQNKTKRDS